MASAPKKMSAAAQAEKPVAPAAPAVAAPVAAAPAVAVETPNFDPVAASEEIQAQLRSAAEKALEATREAYARMKKDAENVQRSFEQSAQAASEGVAALQDRMVDAVRAQSEVQFELMKSLIGVKSMADAISLNAEAARKQFDAMVAQAREFSSLAQKAATDTVEPLKAVLPKAA